LRTDVDLLESLRSRPASRALVECVRRAFGASTPAPVLAAVSGGSDSIALLVLLKTALPHTEITAAYVDHRVRATAPLEAHLVAGLCRRLGVGFATGALAAPIQGGEAELREGRYRELRRIARERGARWIATGHTRDDQIETIVFRFLRGSSRLGLGGMRARRRDLLRPLLGVAREDLRACLLAAGIGWVEDPTNGERRYARNRIRHDVIPALTAAMGSGRLAHLCDVAELWRDEDLYLETEARRFAAYAVRGSGRSAHVELAALERAPRVLHPRILRAWLAGCGIAELSTRQLAALRTLASMREGSASLTLGPFTVVRDYARLSVQGTSCGSPLAEIEVDVEAPGVYEGSQGQWRLAIDPSPAGDAPAAASLLRQVIDLPKAALRQPLRVGVRRPGETIRTRVHGRRKLNDMMIEAQVPRSVRASWPVLRGADSVLWVPGVAVSAEMESAFLDDRAPRVRFVWSRVSL
jgi:tRNA(Ile)-lysidine synthase